MKRMERIFDIALKSYMDKTDKNLKEHDLFKQLHNCNSPAEILAVFQTAHLGSNDRLRKWLVPILNVLCVFSDMLSTGVTLVSIDAFIVTL